MSLRCSRLVAFGLLLSLGGLTQAGPPEATHWAYQLLRRPALPANPGLAAAHPIDAFIQARLTASGLTPAPEASARILLRRLSYDLVGLPPTPGELEEFERACATETQRGAAYSREVERLLASPRHGERWARHWLDAAHFAETHGHDQDRIRTNAWPYRDWLIQALNRDMPYARFVQAQVAGDVLFPADPQATVALGFIAGGPWDESSLRDIREDTLDRQIGRYLDRDDMVSTVMSVFTSTTVHCARCHDHKFDPISQGDYYSLQAVFAGVERANRVFDENPAVHQRRQGLLQRRRQLDRGDTNLLFSAATRSAVEAWRARHVGEPVAWQTLVPPASIPAGSAVLTRQADGSLLASGPTPERDTYTVPVPAPPGRITALQLEVLPDDSLPHRGPGRQAQNGNLHLSEFRVVVEEPGSRTPQALELVNPTADFNQDGWTIAHALDGNGKTAWGIHPQEGKPHRAVFELREPREFPAGTTLAFVLQQSHGGGHLLGRFRFAFTGARGPVRVLPDALAELARPDPATLTPAQWIRLADHVLRENLRRDLATLPAPSLVYAAAAEFEPDGSLRPPQQPRPVHVLHRGEITRPREEAVPGTLACVPGLPARFTIPPGAEEGARRAALAGWLTALDNPLVWRSIVNRVWHHHFGRGLVDTPHDFGRMGGIPSHPELLDWLAVWFRDEAGGSLKALHRLIVTSATYRQASAPRPGRAGRGGAGAVDPDNRLLAHMNRTRLDAECVRDAVLAVSGRLDLRMGGPGDRQFDLQPGIHVTPRIDYQRFDVDSDAGRRRSIYRFLFRTLPDPFMDALDCPAGDQLTAARHNNVTVQQALALWNNAFMARHAAHLAARLEGEPGPLEARIQRAFQLTLGRAAARDELREFVAYTRTHGLAAACRLLFNANEFVFVD
ncbi:MAG: hypothetical protein RJA22_1719 [Verrucomicrobiota bacterium]